MTISQIIINEEYFDNKIKKASDLDFTEGYTFKNLGKVHCKRTLSPVKFKLNTQVSEGDLDELFIFKVLEDSDIFRNEILGFKHYKGKPKFFDQKIAC